MSNARSWTKAARLRVIRVSPHRKAEEVGFEPTVPRSGTPVFETGLCYPADTEKQGIFASLCSPRSSRIRLAICLQNILIIVQRNSR
jgi:hypothetical protein